MDTEALARTRQSLHGVAELVLAGPQYRTSGTIRLGVRSGGFATVATPALGVEGSELVVGTRRIAMDGLTIGQLAADAGVHAGEPEGLYTDGSGCTAESIVDLDIEAVHAITNAFETGLAGLRAFAPELTPVLWPEHFDLGIQLGEVNYGVSAGDSYLGEPYAYVGPWTPRSGAFWNAPFGAVRAMTQLADAESVRAFFDEGRVRASAD